MAVDAEFGALERDPQESGDARANQLLDRLLEGDLSALSALYRLYGRLVYTIAFRILKDPGEAEDLVQEVFLKVYQSSEANASGVVQVRSWIIAITYNTSLDRWRHLSSRKFYKSDPLDTIASAETSTRLDLPELLAVQQRLNNAMALLTSPQQETLRLYFSEGYSLQEIATRSEDSLGNVRNHFYRGLARMRRLITS